MLHGGTLASPGPHLGRGWRARARRPLVLGHRGASAYYPENTLIAFRGAMDAGADGVELDVRLCQSGELLVFHDEDLMRMCGDPRRVDAVPWEELRDLRVAGQAIPRLDEVFASFPDALVNVEIKKHPARSILPLVQATIHAIRAARALHQVLVSSFDPRVLALLRTLAPEIPRGLLFARTQGLVLRRGWLAAPLSVVAVHPQHHLVDRASLDLHHSRGQMVNVWTVDDSDRIAYLARLGVDTLICNDPAAALESVS